MTSLCESCSSPPRLCCECRHVVDATGNWLAPKWSSWTKLVATILSGGNRETELPDAVRSVAGFVDGVLFVHTGPSADEAVRIGLDLCRELGLVAHVAYYTEQGDSFNTASARNFALQAAGDIGYTWAVTVDTDERLQLRDGVTAQHLKRELDATGQNVILANIATGDYPKERLFRLPAKGYWQYRVHEAYHDDLDFTITASLTFSELPKPKEEVDALQRRVMQVCREEIAAGINPARHWMYLGATLCHFERFAEAADAFYHAAELAEMKEHKAWNYFRAATMCHTLGAHELAIDFATIGMRHYPAMPELTWACAYSFWAQAKAQFERNESHVENAMSGLAMADPCIALGRQMPPDPHIKLRHFMPIRTYQQAPFASYEGPWQVRRACLGMLGLTEDLQQADAMVKQALIARTGKSESEQGETT